MDRINNQPQEPTVGCMPYLILLTVSVIIGTLALVSIKELRKEITREPEREVLEMTNGHTYILYESGRLFHDPDCKQCKDTCNVQEESIQ